MLVDTRTQANPEGFNPAVQNQVLEAKSNGLVG
jgi:hypothetical protein